MSDPPWRLDPLQTIIRVKAKSNKKKRKPGGEGELPPIPDHPSYCRGYIANCCPACCATCFCPGILCIGPGGCCGIYNPPCSFIGLSITCGPQVCGSCSSCCWVNDMFAACPGDCLPGQIELAPDYSKLDANFVSAQQLRDNPPHYP